MRPAVLATLAIVLLAGCGDTQTRSGPLIPTPIGRGVEFRPPPGVAPGASCRAGRLQGRYRVHLELFANRKVVIIPAGVGLQGRTLERGRVVRARCRSPLRTLDPTGVVQFDRTDLRLSDFFTVWGVPFDSRRLLSFEARRGSRVMVFVNGLRRRGDVGAVPLRDGDEIVVELNGFIPPHRSYLFPPRG